MPSQPVMWTETETQTCTSRTMTPRRRARSVENQPHWILMNRLFLNDGNGFFSDATMFSLTPAITASNFSNSAAMADFDGDGLVDIAKQTNGTAQGALATVAYGNASPVGTFSTLQGVHGGAAYSISTGDLNGDGRVDMIISENGLDGVAYNTGTTGGQATWSPLVPFEFLSGSDDSYAANSLAADLDGDGLDEVLISDIDPQVAGTNRRLHIYHNRGNDPSGSAILRGRARSVWSGRLDRLPGSHDIGLERHATTSLASTLMVTA